jgi:hypothetical protein
MIMFIEKTISSFCCGICLGECLHSFFNIKKKRTAFMKAYDLGYKKIMHELDITKLIKSIKNVRNIMKKKFKNDNDMLTI